MLPWGKLYALVVLIAMGVVLKGCGLESRQTQVGTMSLAAPEVVSFATKDAPLRAVFALRNPAAKATFEGALYTLECIDAAGQPVTPGLLIVTRQDRAAALERLSAQDISHIIELNDAWAPGQVVNGDVTLSANNGVSITDCTGLSLKGAW